MAAFELFPSNLVPLIPVEQVQSVVPLLVHADLSVVNPNSVQIHSPRYQLSVQPSPTPSAELESWSSHEEEPEDRQSIDSADSQASVIYPRATQYHRQFVQSVRDSLRQPDPPYQLMSILIKGMSKQHQEYCSLDQQGPKISVLQQE